MNLSPNDARRLREIIATESVVLNDGREAVPVEALLAALPADAGRWEVAEDPNPASEIARLLAEGDRLNGEYGRLLAEGDRLNGEYGRLLAEGDRLNGEYGRLLAERDRLIAQGVDPADLDVPLEP
jgi:hypothetical protein